MTLRDAVLTIAVVLLAIILVVTSALTDLRSPAGTAALGATLADDENVRTLIVTGVVDAILEDVTGRSGALGPLVALAEPLLTASVVAALDTPGGRAALTSALTDALRQLSIPGPIVIDLRAAALAAAEDVPAPLDTLIRTAVAQGSVGLLVLGGVDDEDSTVDPPQPLALDDVGRVAGLPPGLARLLSALALVAVGLLLMVPGTRTDAAPGARPTRRSLRLGVAGAALLIIGGVTTLLLRAAPDAVTERLVAALPQDGRTGEALALLLSGVADLLVPTGRVGLMLAVIGAVAVIAGMPARPPTR
jgi:hypothetical protein